MDQSTQSVEVLNALSNRLGTIQYDSLQAIRQPFYFRIVYPAAGANSFYFYGSAVGQNATTLQDTNTPKAGSFGQQSLLIKSISMTAYVESDNVTLWTGADSTTAASDIVAGFAQAGVLRFTIGGKSYLTAPIPFQLLAPSAISPTFVKAGLASLTGAVSGSSMTGITTILGPAPRANLTRQNVNTFCFDPAILLAPEQQFSVELGYDSGVVPIIGTGPVTTSQPYFIECLLDGVLIRPTQ